MTDVTDAIEQHIPKRRRRGSPKKIGGEVEHAANLAMALDLRKQGYTYQEIANLAGYGNKGSVYHAIQTALEKYEAEHVDDYRAEELDRLNGYLQELYPHRLIITYKESEPDKEIKTPNLDIYEQLITLSKERRKLLGLDLKATTDAPPQNVRRTYAYVE